MSFKEYVMFKDKKLILEYDIKLNGGYCVYKFLNIYRSIKVEEYYLEIF